MTSFWKKSLFLTLCPTLRGKIAKINLEKLILQK